MLQKQALHGVSGRGIGQVISALFGAVEEAVSQI
jgi:hypothetical protein